MRAPVHPAAAAALPYIVCCKKEIQKTKKKQQQQPTVEICLPLCHYPDSIGQGFASPI
jgi:hypothetical protein